MGIGFLLGSGFSRAAGMPTVNELTKMVLAGDFHRHSDGTYYPGVEPNPDLPDHYTGRVVEFIRLLKSEIDSYYQSRSRELDLLIMRTFTTSQAKLTTVRLAAYPILGSVFF